MTITYYPDLVQGSDEWLAQRCGLLTASEMKLIITPANLKPASNDKERAHLYELLAQRITEYVEPTYVSNDMLRGQEDEVFARAKYDEHFNATATTGFVTNDRWGFKIGYSPDALVGEDGLIEAKSRRQKFQIETIASDEVPAEYMMQLQTGLLVTERAWIDFISYSGGLPMYVKRVYPDRIVQSAILVAAGIFEAKLAEKWAEYRTSVAAMAIMIETDRRVEAEMYIEGETK